MFSPDLHERETGGRLNQLPIDSDLINHFYVRKTIKHPKDWIGRISLLVVGRHVEIWGEWQAQSMEVPCPTYIPPL